MGTAGSPAAGINLARRDTVRGTDHGEAAGGPPRDADTANLKTLVYGGGPMYVEEVLLRHPAVSEVSVVGEPDPEWGENVVAFVVAKEGARFDAADLDRLCLEHIARFKRPKRYELIDALPKNMTGKVLKTELRKRLAPRGPA